MILQNQLKGQRYSHNPIIESSSFLNGVHPSLRIIHIIGSSAANVFGGGSNVSAEAERQTGIKHIRSFFCQNRNYAGQLPDGTKLTWTKISNE